jgi:hypothetical protein
VIFYYSYEELLYRGISLDEQTACRGELCLSPPVIHERQFKPHCSSELTTFRGPIWSSCIFKFQLLRSSNFELPSSNSHGHGELFQATPPPPHRKAALFRNVLRAVLGGRSTLHRGTDVQFGLWHVFFWMSCHRPHLPSGCPKNRSPPNFIEQKNIKTVIHPYGTDLISRLITRSHPRDQATYNQNTKDKPNIQYCRFFQIGPPLPAGNWMDARLLRACTCPLTRCAHEGGGRGGVLRALMRAACNHNARGLHRGRHLGRACLYSSSMGFPEQLGNHASERAALSGRRPVIK